MKTMRYRFTLLIPFYNSEKFIHRVFSSINNFIYRNFEVIMINDASTDNTHQMISEFINNLTEPVRYIKWDKNKGLSENIRYGLSIAEGEYILIMGHDDEYYADTLGVFNKYFSEYDSDEIAGIGALCVNQYGELVDYKYPKDFQIEDFFKICYGKRQYRKEIPFCFKTLILKRYFDEFVNPAPYIGCYYKYIFINKVIRTYYINENPNSLSARTRKQTAYESYRNYIYWINYYQYKMRHAPLYRYKGIFAYPYHGILAGVSFKEMLKPIKKRRNKIFIALFYFPAFIVSKIIN
ncbi:MAG: glycosyltransferase family 2 protein [Bacteroidales bacterium]|nr:glycosyltransferase family 2 protein [Bacteroidales bacterium]